MKHLEQREPAVKGGRTVTAGGFTMVELLMTMMILSISLAGLAALQLNTIRQVTQARRTNEATRLAQATLDRYTAIQYAKIKELDSAGEWGIARNPPTASDGISMLGVQVDGRTSGGPFTVHHVVEDISGGLKRRYQVTIRVTWLDIMPGTDPDPARRYRTQSVMVSTKRAD